MQGIDNTRAGGALSSLSDVNISSPAVGDLLIYNGSEWINDEFAGGHTILNQSGTAVTDEANLQFTNGLKVTDDSTNHITKVEVDTEFEQAYTRANINSGDPLSTILGKIKKWFADLPSLFVSRSGDNMAGPLGINSESRYSGIIIGGDWEHKTTVLQPATILIGNSIPDGALNCCRGQLRIYGNGSNYTNVEAPDSTANRTITFPNADGIVALTTDIPTKVSQLTNDSGFITSSGTAANVSGTVAIANGGTGATTRLDAAKNLTNEEVTNPGFVVGLTNNWGKFGWTTLGNLVTALGVVKKSGDTMTGALIVHDDNIAQAIFDRNNTGTAVKTSMVQIGNDIPDGTTGATNGLLRIFGKTNKFVDFYALPTSNRDIVLPDASGTLALSGTVPKFTAFSTVTGSTKTAKINTNEFALIQVKVNNNDYFICWLSDVCGNSAYLNDDFTDISGGYNIKVRVAYSNRQYWIAKAIQNGSDVTENSTLVLYRMTI